MGLALLLTACPRTQTPPAASDAPATSDEVEMRSSETPTPKGKRAAGQEHEPLLAWRAFGTEPFWEARVDGDTLVFSTPDDQAGKSMPGKQVPSLVGFVYVGRDGDKEFHLDISPGECSDGMSDNRYEFVATFIYGGTTYKGCGESAK